tara:strand:+ start:321 stop:542 length:222 start_codon:yes stop_codon:yes gene_type:complete
MRNSPLKAFASPLKKGKEVDTSLVDKVYTKTKVDEDLKKKGLHTEGELRGTKDTTPTAGVNVGMDSQMINIPT